MHFIYWVMGYYTNFHSLLLKSIFTIIHKFTHLHPAPITQARIMFLFNTVGVCYYGCPLSSSSVSFSSEVMDRSSFKRETLNSFLAVFDSFDGITTRQDAFISESKLSSSSGENLIEIMRILLNEMVQKYS